jgi:hypothetical protein
MRRFEDIPALDPADQTAKATMRRIASIIATTCFAIGFVWQYGGWLLEWVGRALGVRGLTTTYDAFVGEYVTALIAEGSFARIIAPWLLMGIGLIVLAFLYLPDRQRGRPE